MSVVSCEIVLALRMYHKLHNYEHFRQAMQASACQHLDGQTAPSSGDAFVLPSLPLPREPRAADLAYLLFTSGTTGTPKGVACHHLGAVNTLTDLNAQFKLTQNDRVLALSSLRFVHANNICTFENLRAALLVAAPCTNTLMRGFTCMLQL